jgi:glutathione S-transferase
MNSQQQQYIITYFEFRARAEVIKLICEEGGLSYRVNLVSDYPNWPQSSFFESTPFGHLPVLQIQGNDHFILAQTLAISRFLSEQCELIPKDALNRALCDSLVNELSDIRATIYKMFLSGTDKETEILVEQILPQKYDKLDRFIRENGGEWAIGDEFSWADIALFDLIDESINFGLFQFPSSSAEEQNLLALMNHYHKVLDRPRISRYVHSDERPDVPKYYEAI